MAVVKKWPLWEGRGVIRQFFREYDVSVVITSWLLYLYNGYPITDILCREIK